MRRQKQNRFRAAKQFNRNTSRTKRINVAPPPARAGYRL